MHSLKVMTVLWLICLSVVVGLSPIWSHRAAWQVTASWSLGTHIMVILVGAYFVVFTVPLAVAWFVVGISRVIRWCDSPAQHADLPPRNPPVQPHDAGHRWLG